MCDSSIKSFADSLFSDIAKVSDAVVDPITKPIGKGVIDVTDRIPFVGDYISKYLNYQGKLFENELQEVPFLDRGGRYFNQVTTGKSNEDRAKEQRDNQSNLDDQLAPTEGPTPLTEEEEQLSARRARYLEEMRAKRYRGHYSTILTGPQGASQAAPVKRPELSGRRLGPRYI